MMIAELANLIDDFPGPANQTRCFTHVLNLVVKSILHQFDLHNSKSGEKSDDRAKELLSLAGNIEVEEFDSELRDGEDGVAGEESEDDNF